MVVPQPEGAFLNQLSPSFDGVAHDELSFLGSLGANLLLIGVDAASRDQIEASLIPLRGPVTKWAPGTRLALPSADARGTLLLHEVGSLTHDEQVRLLSWLEQTAGRTRVVCTASSSLYALVEAKKFIHTLYYRLNTVSFNVAPRSRK